MVSGIEQFALARRARLVIVSPVVVGS